jgi:hypothetical protein
MQSTEVKLIFTRYLIGPEVRHSCFSWDGILSTFCQYRRNFVPINNLGMRILNSTLSRKSLIASDIFLWKSYYTLI